MPEGQRWDATRASKVVGKPWDLRAARQGGAQEEPERQDTDAPTHPERPPKARQFKMERWMFESHGWSPNCPACKAKKRNPLRQGVIHSDGCRRRIEAAVSSTPEGAARVQRAKTRFNQAVAEEMERQIPQNDFSRGDRIKTKDLRKHSHLNNATGTVAGYLQETDRWQVVMDDDSVKNIHAKNMEKIEEDTPRGREGDGEEATETKQRFPFSAEATETKQRFPFSAEATETKQRFPFSAEATETKQRFPVSEVTETKQRFPVPEATENPEISRPQGHGREADEETEPETKRTKHGTNDDDAVNDDSDAEEGDRGQDDKRARLQAMCSGGGRDSEATPAGPGRGNAGCVRWGAPSSARAGAGRGLHASSHASM